MSADDSSTSRRGFVGGLATAFGYLTLTPRGELLAHAPPRPSRAAGDSPAVLGPEEDYDGWAKLGNNENPYGPSEPVMKAMTKAWKYAPRYGYPDGGITEAIAQHHGVKPENILLGAGSGEILGVVGGAYVTAGRMVVGAEPTYHTVFQYASGIKADAIRLPLLADFRQDIPAMIAATKRHYREIGLVYLCNPNNPTGRIVTKDEVRQLLDGLPEDIPVLIDEAYHHYVEDPAYATSLPYVTQGRRVIIARTFSKIAGLAAMRLGYAVAPADVIRELKPHSTGSINALVKHGGVAALQDVATQATIRKEAIELRTRATKELTGLGYSVIPSEANFFMVHIRRPVVPVIEEFKKRGVVVGRPFPPMNEHLRVSIGTPDEMKRFSVAFRDIVGGTARADGAARER